MSLIHTKMSANVVGPLSFGTMLFLLVGFAQCQGGVLCSDVILNKPWKLES
jgi:hypothetical protein